MRSDSPMPSTNRIARKTKLMRIQRGLSRRQLAMKSGLSKSTIARLENSLETGEVYDPHMQTIASLCRGFQIGMAEFTATSHDRVTRR